MLGVVGIWRDAVPILDRLALVRRDVVLVTLSAALIAAALLFLIFRAAQRRLTRQTAELIESTRRDPLTGTLNHGTVVGLLAMETEAARAAGLPVTIALVDIDNFRLLNENHGHRPATRRCWPSRACSAARSSSPWSWAAPGRTSS